MRVPRIMALLRDRRGVTAVEYGLIAGAIFVAIATAVGSLGTATLRLWQAAVDAFPS